MSEYKQKNGMDDGSLGQIQEYAGTTKVNLIGIETRNLKDKAEALKLVKENGVFLPALSVRMQRDKQVIIEAIKSHPYAIMDLPKSLRNDSEIQKAYDEGMSKKARSIYKKQRLTEEMQHILELMMQEETVEINGANHVKSTPKITATDRLEKATQKPIERGSEIADIADLLGL